MKKKLFVGFAFAIIISGLIFICITINPLFNIFSSSGILDKELSIAYGTLIGGLFGPILSLLSFFLVFITFKEQKKFNEHQILKGINDNFINSIERDIQYLRNYVSSIKYRNPELLNPTKDLITGEEYFIKAVKQLNCLNKMILPTKIFNDERNRIGAIFEIFFYGVGLDTEDTLKYYLNKRTSNENTELLIKKIREEKTKYNSNIVCYGGHQGRLGHYFRQLYGIIDKINKTGLSIDKTAIMNNINLKMSNYELAILCYYSFTFVGKNWKENNYLGFFEAIKNIPWDILPFDLKNYF